MQPTLPVEPSTSSRSLFVSTAASLAAFTASSRCFSASPQLVGDRAGQGV
jgi:hypothetical protein